MPRPHPDMTAERSVLATVCIGIALSLGSGGGIVPVSFAVRVFVPLVAFVATEAGGRRGAIVSLLGAAAGCVVFASRDSTLAALLLGALAGGGVLGGWLTRRGFPLGTAVTAMTAPAVAVAVFLYATGAAGFRQVVLQRLDDVVAAYRTGNVFPPQVANVLPTVRDLWVQFFPLLFGVAVLCTMLAVYLFGAIVLSAMRRPELLVGRFRFWRVPDVIVWVLIAGLACLILKRPPFGTVGANLTGVSLIAYAAAGLAIIRFYLLAWGLATSLQCLVLGGLFVAGVLSQVPLVPAFSVALGFLDTWLDFRGLNGPPLSAGRQSAIHQ